MKFPHSLVSRLTILISISLLVIWLLSVFASTYVATSEIREHIIGDISHFSMLQVQLSHYRFAGAERDVQMLAHNYSIYHSAPLRELPVGKSAISHFTVDTSNCPPTCSLKIQQNQARRFIQTYGIAGQTYYLDSFILDNTQGISLLPPQDHVSDYFARRRFGLRDFPRQPTHDNLFWGKPEYIPGKGWSVSVATADSKGILIGLAVEINDLLSTSHAITGRDVTLWLDQHNRLLPFSSADTYHAATLQKILQATSLHEGWQKITGYWALRTQLNGPGWQQVILYPDRGTVPLALSIIARQLPFALTVLFLLVLILFWLLHRILARPLWHFVSIIDQTKPNSLTVRLPEDRRDELGQIARAYNLLLDTLHSQYDDLELKVAQRTQALTDAKREAEQANQRKSRHLTMISHELRTPLNGALGALELLQSMPLDDQQARLTDTARQCTLSLLDIISNLLDFSRIESGQISLHIEETALLPLLDQAMQTIQGPSQAKGLRLRTFVGKNVPLLLDIDGVHLRQILVNLLGNALKFTATGGIYLNIKRQGEQLVFVVKDSGQGIALADQATVFTPFFKGKRHIQGTGLGLTIAANLARMMNGKLEISSVPELGTRVAFQLPLQRYRDLKPLNVEVAAPRVLRRQLACWGVVCQFDPADGPFSAAELRFLPGKLYQAVLQSHCQNNCEENVPVQPWRLRVLLVDDAAINRDIIKMMLTRLGQHVTTAVDGQQALALGREQRFDLVLMDIRMPGMDGTECAAGWISDPENRDANSMIMALSASTTPEEKARCQHASIQHYLTKPVTLAQLANAISITAEYQLQRGMPLEEQDPALGTALLSTGNSIMREKIRQSLLLSLDELAQHRQDQDKTAELLHRLKGCLGQAQLNAPLESVIVMENRALQGYLPQQKEITALHDAINRALSTTQGT